MASNFNFTDADLLRRLRTFEDHFTERKSYGDDADWLKTVVAFANSAPIGFPCVLFIGVTDKGEIQTSQTNIDTLQQKLSKKLALAYPQIPYYTRAFGEDDKQALAVIVAGSAMRPHFAGPPYVRRGSVSQRMSDEEYREALAMKDSKASRILEYKDKPVAVVNVHGKHPYREEHRWHYKPTVEYCDSHYVILAQPGSPARTIFPLDEVRLSFDTSDGGILILQHLLG